MHNSLNYVDSTFNIKSTNICHHYYVLELLLLQEGKKHNILNIVESTLNLKTYFKVIGGVKYIGCIFSLSLLTKPRSHCNVLSRNGAYTSWVPENVLTCGH
jgi:hypothetical protein